MDLHLQEISQRGGARRHAVLLMDQAGWHTSDKLSVPKNIIPLPPRSPELKYGRERLAAHAQQLAA